MSTTAKKRGWTDWRGINLSNYHGGQICQPGDVEFRRHGNQYEARWSWIDQSIPIGQPGREYGQGSATGTYWAVVAALNKAGIRTDDNTF